MVNIEHIETPAFLVDVLADGSFVYRDGNKPLSERTGLGQRLVKGRSPRALLPEPFASAVVAHYEACVRSVAVRVFEEQFDIDGRSSHWRTTLIPLQEGGAGRVTTLLGILADITEAKRAEIDLLRTHARLTLALQAVQGAHWEYEVHTHRFEASPSLALLLGDTQARPVRLDEWIRTIPVADRPSASFHPLVDGTSAGQVTRFRVVTGTGEERWLRCRRVAVRDATGTVQIIFGVTVDITDEVLSERRLVHEAQHDGLTGLLNRGGFHARLGALATECERSGEPLCVLMLDLDGFKAINDTRGHAAGDAVLAACGTRIAALLRPGDCAARLGGDEFAIAVRGRDGIRARQFVDRLRDRLERGCLFKTDDIPVAVSIGMTTWETGRSPAAAVEDADAALYVEKRLRRAAGRRGLAEPFRRSA